jgi:hypothetical protein
MSFNQLRNEIARAAGYQIEASRVETPWGTRANEETVVLDQKHFPPGHELGEWDEMPKDPLLILLAHSDYNGRIKAEHCAALADALEVVLPKLAGSADRPSTDRGATHAMIVGLRRASAANEDVEFS